MTALDESLGMMRTILNGPMRASITASRAPSCPFQLFFLEEVACVLVEDAISVKEDSVFFQVLELTLLCDLCETYCLNFGACCCRRISAPRNPMAKQYNIP